MNKTKWIVAGVVLIAGVLAAWRWSGRGRTEADDGSQEQAGAAAAPAAVARVERHNVGNMLTIAGEFKPFQDVDVHAKVAGYIRTINVDVGDHVKQGQTVAVLEVPELAAQLSGADAGMRAAQEQIRRAQGDLQRAQSTQAAAHSAYTRLKQAADSRAGLVAQQEVDDSQAKDQESAAQVASAEAELSGAKQQLEVAQANQKQYTALSSYTRITAPFAGVITNRYADTGALIAAGTSSSTQAIPVVRLAQTSKLRLACPGQSTAMTWAPALTATAVPKAGAGSATLSREMAQSGAPSTSFTVRRGRRCSIAASCSSATPASSQTCASTRRDISTRTRCRRR